MFPYWLMTKPGEGPTFDPTVLFDDLSWKEVLVLFPLCLVTIGASAWLCTCILFNLPLP